MSDYLINILSFNECYEK